MSILNSLRTCLFTKHSLNKLDVNSLLVGRDAVRSVVALTITQPQIRFTSFFNKLPAQALWKGVTSVSNAGKKRGRGKGAGRKMAKDLNRGQIIGVGKVNMVWPGLTVPVLRGRELIPQQKLPEDPEREQKILKLRNEMGQFRRIKISPIERGWSGNRLPGRNVGPPDPIGEDTFEGFETKVLELKTVFNMTGNMGRKRQLSVFVVSGNKEGLAGFGLGKALDGKAAVKSAKNRAGQRLMYIERYNNHTVFHDFFCQFGKTKIYVKKKPEGYGLVCHRAIKSICEIVGIKDLYAKIEGSTNLQHIVKAFFIGLLQQKNHNRLAEETGLNVVELKKEKDLYPEVVASPSSIVTKSEISREFQDYIMNGKVALKKKKYPPFFTKSVGWNLHLKKTLRFRNHDQSRLNVLVEEGCFRSFLYKNTQEEEKLEASS